MSDLETTRLSLHAVAELLLGGPQYEQSKSIHLRVTPGGFGTVAAPAVRVQGESVVADGRAVPLSGRTVAEVAADAGLTARSLDDVYSGGSGLTDDYALTVDVACAAELAEAFRVGDEALAEFAPDAQRVLWPEHFDLGITAGPRELRRLAGRRRPRRPLRVRRPLGHQRPDRLVLEHVLRGRPTTERGR